MLETTEKVVYSCLDLFPRNVSEIQMKTGLDARILMETLMTLEMEGYIKETAKELLCQNVRCEMKHLHLNENSVREFARYR